MCLAMDFLANTLHSQPLVVYPLCNWLGWPVPAGSRSFTMGVVH
jgi:hypothetical protein